MSWNAEKFKGRQIHIVHAEMYRSWLEPFVLSARDRAFLMVFFSRLQELTYFGIKYENVIDTQGFYGAKPGDSVVIGGCIYGVCPEEHGEYLERNHISISFSKSLSWVGPLDNYDPKYLPAQESKH